MSATSKSQQRFFGMVSATQKGELKKPSSAVASAAKSMSKTDVDDFASTKHDDLPEKVKKEIVGELVESQTINWNTFLSEGISTLNKKDFVWACKATILELSEEFDVPDKSLKIKYINEQIKTLDEKMLLKEAPSAADLRAAADVNNTLKWLDSGMPDEARGMSNSGKAGIVVGIVAIIAASYYVYKRFLSKAARSCKGLSGNQKTICITKFKIAGAKAAIQKLEQSKQLCRKNSNPENCVRSINMRIQKWNIRIAKYQRKLT